MAFELVPGHRAVLLPIPRIDISSSLVRQRWLEERSLAWLLPDGVDEVLPPQAHALEETRRRMLDLLKASDRPDGCPKQGAC